MAATDGILAQLENLGDQEIRGKVIMFGVDGPDPGTPYRYQHEALRRIEAGSSQVPPDSGILWYPTGAGKTRVGVELIARAVARYPEHRFVWATARRNLVRQSMMRLIECARLFPANTTLKWCKNADDLLDGSEEPTILFMTRDTLTKVLSDAADGRQKNHPWRCRLERRQPITLIYDECHQLGAAELQKSWTRFHDNLVRPKGAWSRPWRTIGLSATPIPTSQDAHELLQRAIFPRSKGGGWTCHDWPVNVFHRVTNDELVSGGVLCPISQWLDEKGDFDIPRNVLAAAIADAQLPELGANAALMDRSKYATSFNAKVMASRPVVAFLAERLGRAIQSLGKTIVFVPNIESANRMAALIYEGFPELRGYVAAVHSEMNQLQLPGQQGKSVHEVLARFKSFGGKPSILVNVNMLTEGFDDPKISTVVLARLTMSTNLFWQMIGRGTRGPASGGTEVCNVIDPVKLTRIYDYFAGYQPSFRGGPAVEFEDANDTGDKFSADQAMEGASPEVPLRNLPPSPSVVRYGWDPELEKVNFQVAKALHHFVTGEAISEDEAVGFAHAAAITMNQGGPVLVACDKGFQSDTAMSVLLGELAALEKRTGNDVTWLRPRILPGKLSDPEQLRHRLRMLRAVETLGLWTDGAFCAAEMTDAFARAMMTPAVGVSEAASFNRVETLPVDLTSAESEVVDSGLFVALADGNVNDSELGVVIDMLRELFGRASSDALRATITARAPSLVEVHSPPRITQVAALHRPYLTRRLADVAIADGIVTLAERRALSNLFVAMGEQPILVDYLVGPADAADPGIVAVPEHSEMTKLCVDCGFEMPEVAAYCGGCGVRMG